MLLDDQERTLVETAMDRYCANKVPVHVRNKIQMAYRIRGASVTLVERRSPWSGSKSGNWTEHAVAQFRLNPKAKRWSLYCADRNGRWFDYADVGPAKSIQTLLEEVDRDPMGIFWG